MNIFGTGAGPLRFIPEIVKSSPRDDPAPAPAPASQMPKIKKKKPTYQGTGQFSIGKPCPGMRRAPRNHLVKWPLIVKPDHPEYK